MYTTYAFLFCLASIGFAVLILGFLLAWRYIAYRENLAYAEKGLLPAHKPGNNKAALIWGIIISAIGMALCLGLWPLGMSTHSFPLGLGPWMLAGFLPLFFGLGLILVYVLTRKEVDQLPPAATGQEPLPAATEEK